MEEMSNLLGSMALDERAARKTIAAAKNGSFSDLEKLPGLMPTLSPTLVVEVVTLFCTFLDVPAFNPERPLSKALTERRGRALAALACIGNISDAVVVDPKASVHAVIQRNWAKILNWMKYFYFEATPKDGKGELLNTVITIIAAIAMKISHNRSLYEKAMLKDGLFELTFKVWLKTDDSGPFDAAHRYRILMQFYDGLAIIDEHDARRTPELRAFVLCEAGGNTRVITKRIMRQLKNPAKVSRECYQIVLYAIGIVVYLAIEHRSQGSSTVFMNSFLKDDLVLLTTQVFAFLAEDLARPTSSRVFPESTYPVIVPHCIRILGCCVRSRNGPHWVAVMLKNGFLRSMAGIASFPQHLETGRGNILEVMIDHDIQQYFCHRTVVAAATRAVKEISIDGTVEKLKSSFLKIAWKDFENLLLERTIQNAVYERDFAGNDVMQCLNCRKDKLETQLFKCAGCRTAVYCSKECQTESWKTGGHKSDCKSMYDAWYHSGMKLPTDDFLYQLAMTEIHRHTPGVRKMIASEENPNGIPLKDAFFIVSYGYLPPTIVVKAANDVLNTPGQKDETRAVIQHVLDVVRKNEGKGLPMQIHAHQGGYIPTISAHLVPSNLLDFGFGDIHDGDEKIQYLDRKPARDTQKRSLPFILDDTDAYLIDARKNFRPPVGDDQSSPKTIYHYVEQKVAAGSSIISLQL